MKKKQKAKSNFIIIIFLCFAGLLLIRYKTREPVIKDNYTSNEKISNYEVKLAFFGNTAEAPLFIGDYKKFFIREGIKVKLVKINVEDIKEKINSGEIDGVTADYRIFKNIQNGIKLKLVAGLNSGCMELVTLKKYKITDIRDLNNKTIGVDYKGSGAMTVASKLLESNDIDTVKDVKWKYYEGKDMTVALNLHKIDAICRWENYNKAKTTDKDKGYKVIFSSSAGETGGHSHNPYKHFYEGFAALSDKVINKHPQLAAAITRAWIKSTNWISENRKQTIELLLKQKYVSGDYKSINDDLNTFMWMPGVRYASKNISLYLEEQKDNGIIKPKTDIDKLLDKSFSQVIPDLNGI